MSRLSPAAQQAVFAQETDVAFIYLVTIEHPDFTEPLRVASDGLQLLPVAGVRGVVSRGEEFVFCNFTIIPPTSDENGIARARLEIDNTDRRIVRALRRSTPPTITIELVLSSNVDRPEISLPEFRLEKVSYNALTLSGDVSLAYYDLEPFPWARFTPSLFPGLF